MRSKISLCLVILFTVLSISCDKKSDEILAMLQQIKQQNTDLKIQVTNLQKTTDSLSAALKITNQNISSMDKKIDSIRNQLSSMVTQINSLSVQLTQANVNIADLQIRIAELQAKCQEMLDLLRLLTGTIKLSDGLIAYFPFNGNANDESGNGNHGSIVGATLSINRNGLTNQAFYFNGVSDYIQFADNIQLRSAIFTIDCWINGEDYNGFKQVIAKNLGISSNESINLVVNNNLIVNNNYSWNLSAQVGGSNYYGTLISSPQNLNINKWYHITYVYRGIGNFQDLYINEALVNQNLAKNEVQYDSKPWTIGSQIENGNMSFFFKGKIDDIRIYNRALTQSEITYLATH